MFQDPIKLLLETEIRNERLSCKTKPSISRPAQSTKVLLPVIWPMPARVRSPGMEYYHIYPLNYPTPSNCMCVKHLRLSGRERILWTLLSFDTCRQTSVDKSKTESIYFIIVLLCSFILYVMGVKALGSLGSSLWKNCFLTTHLNNFVTFLFPYPDIFALLLIKKLKMSSSSSTRLEPFDWNF